jgi:hypothetical protein
MARPEVTGKKLTSGALPPLAAFTIAEFVRAHRLSVSMYYKLKAQGLAPVEMAVGKRRYVSFEAAERWRREREAAAAS